MITTALTLLYQWKNFCRKMRVRSQQRSPIQSVACAAKMWHDAQAARGGQRTTVLQRTRSRARLRTQQSARNLRRGCRRRHLRRHRRPRLPIRSTQPQRVQIHLRQQSRWILQHPSLEPVRTLARRNNHRRPVQRSVDVVAVVARVVRRAAGQAADQTADRTAAPAVDRQASHQAEAALDRHARVPRYDPLR